MIYTLQKIDRGLYAVKDWFGAAYPWRYAIGPCLYCGVIFFNVAVTFYIGEYNLGLVDVFIILLPAFLIYSVMRSKLSAQSDEALRAHLSDFPDVTI